MSDIATAIDRMVTEADLMARMMSAEVHRPGGDGHRLGEMADKACRLAQESAGIAKQMASSLRLLHGGRFRFRTLEEARGLASCVASLFPDPGAFDVGICELLLNAVEHGNLGITYEEKSQLLASDRLEAEVARRLALPQYAGRYATLELERKPAAIRLTVKDEGDGFDWRPYLEFCPNRAHALHGRGIATARQLCFPQLTYQGTGNEVTVVIELPIQAGLDGGPLSQRASDRTAA